MCPVNGNRGLVTPITLTFLLFSFSILTVATYYFAVSSVKTRVSRLNWVAAKQDMLLFEDSINSVAWLPSSSIMQSFKGYGGEFETKPELRNLVVNVTLGTTEQVVFNSSIGYVRYEMPPSDLGEADVHLVGGEEPIINRSFQSSAQMYVRINGDNQEIYLGYRPLAISFLDASETGITNVVRIFIVNLNSSENLQYTGSFQVRVRCVNVTTKFWNFNLTDKISLAYVKAAVEGEEGTVSLSLSSSYGFTVVRLEVLVCNIKIEEVKI